MKTTTSGERQVAVAERVLSLDSVVFRYEKPDRLRALVDAGFKIRVSAVALVETWASALDRDEIDICAAAVQRLRHLSAEDVPIEPTLETYILERGGTLPARVQGETLNEHRAAYSRAWEIASTKPLTRSALEQGKFLIERVKNERERWLNLCRRWDRDLEWFEGWVWRQAEADGKDPPADLRAAAEEVIAELKKHARDPERREHFVGVVFGQFQGVLRSAGMTQEWVEGAHALGRMLSWRAIRGGAAIATPANHDAGDAHQLAHLAVGAIMTTGDRNFIAAVDACVTHQAPWVCTVDQLLTAPPEGEPIGGELHERSKRSASGKTRAAS